MKISILSNVNMNSIISRVSKAYEVYKPQGYNNWIYELEQHSLMISSFKVQTIFILLDGEELIKNIPNINNIKKEIDRYISYLEKSIYINKNINYIVSNIDIPLKKILSIKSIRVEKEAESYWNERIRDLNSKYENFYIFDLKNMICDIGRNNFYSQKLWYLGSMKYSMKAEKIIEKEIYRYIKAIKGNRKKCLILDLDNTLWGGVIGEDLLEGIELDEFKEGARYKDFQRRLKEIKELGVILAVVSKNNLEDVLEVLKNHKHMVLREEDFVAMKVNWNLKSQNIRELSEELNLGLDSFVFLDDNPIEREMVSKELPEVIVPDFPQDTSDLEKWIINIYNEYFLTSKKLKEDMEKTKMYRQNIIRENSKKNFISFEDYLKSLNTKIKIWIATHEDANRISQLTQKTNQFNLTSKRYTLNDIVDLIENKNYIVFPISVEDKFGDNGIVSVVIIKKNKDRSAYIDTFLMSCRVMGRFIEDHIIEFIEEYLRTKGYNKIISEYIVTKKNKPVEYLYERLGYTIIEKDEKGNKKYVINKEMKKEKRRNHSAKVIKL